MSPLTDVTALYPLQKSGGSVVWWRQAGPASRVTDIAIHHTVSFYLKTNASVQEEHAQLQMIYIYHLKTQGFGGIGYHIIVFPSGRRYLCCPFSNWGANVVNENDHVLGIAAAGRFDTLIPGTLQFDGIAAGIVDCWAYRRADIPIKPHRFWTATGCPGARHNEWVPRLRARALQLRQAPAGPPPASEGEDDMLDPQRDYGTFQSMLRRYFEQTDVNGNAARTGRASEAYRTTIANIALLGGVEVKIGRIVRAHLAQDSHLSTAQAVERVVALLGARLDQPDLTAESQRAVKALSIAGIFEALEDADPDNYQGLKRVAGIREHVASTPHEAGAGTGPLILDGDDIEVVGLIRKRRE